MFGRKEKDALPLLPSQPAYSPPVQSQAAQPPQPQAMAQAQSPPLFIKLDRYNDLVKNLQELRKYSREIKGALDNLTEVEKRLTRGLTASYRTLDSLDTIITMLNSHLNQGQSQVRDIPAMTQAQKHDMEKYFSNIKTEIDRVKTELTTLK